MRATADTRNQLVPPPPGGGPLTGAAWVIVMASDEGCRLVRSGFVTACLGSTGRWPGGGGEQTSGGQDGGVQTDEGGPELDGCAGDGAGGGDTDRAAGLSGRGDRWPITKADTSSQETSRHISLENLLSTHA